MDEDKILIIDDEEALAQFIEKILSGMADPENPVTIQIANTGQDGINLARELEPDVVLLDIKLPDISGIEVLAQLKQMDPDVQVVMMTGFASLETAVAAVREGAYDYINKPFDSSEQLKTIVKNALERRHLIMEKKRLMTELTEVNEALEEANRILEEKKALVDRQLEEKIQELQRLNEFSRKLSSEIDLSKLIGIIFEETKNTTDADACALLLMDRKQKTLVVRKTDSAFPLEVGGVVAIGSKPFGEIDSKGAWTFDETICAPIRFGNEALGVVCVKKEGVQSMKDLFETIASYVSVSLHNAMLFESLKSSYIEAVLSLMLIEETKDPGIREHSLRVSDIATRIGGELKLGESDLNDVRYAALLHDIGKVIDEKESFITGEKILSPIKFLKTPSRYVRYMSEHYDGSGKPEGLKGDEIPIGSRIIAVANRFDELLQEGRDEPSAFKEIESGAEKEFDPEIVEALRKTLRKKGLSV